MELVNNYEKWISDEWLDYISKNEGLKQNGSYNKTPGEHYPFEGFSWELFDRHNTDFKISPPPMFNTHIWQWWIKKLLPGDGFPVVRLTETTRRLWMPLTDYQLGHVYIWEDRMIAPFNKGDLFEFEQNSPYAAVNLGTGPFYMMMFSLAREPQW